jgi:lipid-A-disaccharide synthase
MVGVLSAASHASESNPPGRERRLIVVAGEASGDAHAARVVRALREHGPVRVRAVAGPELRAAGAETIVPQEELAVIGFSGIVAKLPALYRARRALLEETDRFRPDLVVLVDYPGFNLRLGPALKRHGARVLYYIAPQVWAWHAERAAAMAAWVDRLAVVFPFEERLFRDAGVATTFVGHPLLDELHPETDAATFRAELGVAPDARIVGLLPGSRRGELAAHAATLFDVGRRLAATRPDVVPVLALAPGLDEAALAGARATGVRVVRGRTRSVQAHATCCAVASGTATLETALFGTPLAIVYRVGWLNHAIARRVVTLKHIGLPNIVAGREVAPEFLQERFRADAVAEALARWLDDAAEATRCRASLQAVRERLGGPGASRRVAELAWGLAA